LKRFAKTKYQQSCLIFKAKEQQSCIKKMALFDN